MTGLWIGSGGYVIWPLRVVFVRILYFIVCCDKKEGVGRTRACVAMLVKKDGEVRLVGKEN